MRRISLDRRSAAGVVEAVQAALAIPQASCRKVEPPPKLPRGLGPIDRAAAGAAQAAMRGASRRPAPGRDQRRPGGDRGRGRARGRRAQGLALRGLRPMPRWRSSGASSGSRSGAAASPWCRCATSPSRRDGSARVRGRPDPDRRSQQLSRPAPPAAAGGRPGARGRPRADRAAGPARRHRLRRRLRPPPAARQRGLPARDDGPGSAAGAAHRRARPRLSDAELAQGLCARRRAARRGRADRARRSLWPPQARRGAAAPADARASG